MLHEIQARVAAAPGHPAIRAGGETVTYEGLWDRANRLAARLGELGAGPGRTVGVHLERSADLVVSLIAVLRAGAVAVPLDVSYPVDRLRYMCADAGVGLMIGAADRLGDYRVAGRDGDLVLGVPASPPPPPDGVDPGVAYIVYTSGSTGRPKGVVFGRDNLANLIRWQAATSGCGPQDRTLQFAPASFDVIYQEVLTTFVEGGTVVCCTEDERLDPQLLWDLIARERVNRLFVPFVVIQALALFADTVTPGTHPLREILTAGEQVQATSTVRAMFQRLPECRLVNQWGTTETHVTTSYTLPADAGRWPRLPSIGTPIDGADVMVVDERGNRLPPGEVGELWISGACVGPGYLNLPERTAASYVPDPSDPAARAYRTGDLGRVGPDGLLEFLGRRDSQVKVRGFRIELGEIETVLKSAPDVAEAVVAVAGEHADERHLQAFVVARNGALDEGRLVAALRDRLPEYMVPRRVEVLAALPRTPSGKIDRGALTRGRPG